MEQIFNPYRAWLGWEQARAPDYYELLRLDRAETDAGKILLASEKMIALVRSQRPGPHAQIWSRLIDEIRAAKECLTDPGLRTRYNASLERSTTFASATGDLQAARLSTAIPPTPWAAGPSPVYDPRRGFVSVHPVGPERAGDQSFNATERIPLSEPHISDDLLPPGSDSQRKIPADTDEA